MVPWEVVLVMFVGFAVFCIAAMERQKAKATAYRWEQQERHAAARVAWQEHAERSGGMVLQAMARERIADDLVAAGKLVRLIDAELFRRIDVLCFKSCWQSPTLNNIREMVRTVKADDPEEDAD